jgi:hypothetical protein
LDSTLNRLTAEAEAAVKVGREGRD